MGLLDGIQKDRGQPATVRIGTVQSVVPLKIAVQNTVIDPDSVGLASEYVPETGDSVVLVGQSSISSDGSSWLAAGAAKQTTAHTGTLIGYGRRETATGTTTGAEIGLIRLDNLQMSQGNSYLIICNTILFTSVAANTAATMRMRLATTGPATSASNAIALFNSGFIPTLADGISGQISTLYTATTDTTLASVYVGIFRLTGTGNVSSFANGNFATELMVYQVGYNVTNTGVSL